jgi:hypothetical protein
MSTFLFRYWITWFRSVPVLCRNRHFVQVPVPLKDRKFFFLNRLKTALTLQQIGIRPRLTHHGISNENRLKTENRLSVRVVVREKTQFKIVKNTLGIIKSKGRAYFTSIK